MPKQKVEPVSDQHEENPSRKRSKAFNFEDTSVNNAKSVVANNSIPVLRDSMTSWCDVWINNETADVISIFCRRKSDLQRVKEWLKDDHRPIICHLPIQVVAELGGALQFKLSPAAPSIMTVASEKKELSYTQNLPIKTFHQLHFKIQNSGGQLLLGDQCKMLYEISNLNSTGDQINLHSSELNFKWPIENGVAAGPNLYANGQQHIAVESSPSSEDASTGGQAHSKKDEENIQPSEETPEEAELSGASYVTKVKAEVNRALDEKTKKVQTLGADGGSVEVEQCKITFQPNSVIGTKDVAVSVSDNVDSIPASTVAASQMLGKSYKFQNPISVRLTSCLAPKPGITVPVNILSRSGEGDWEPIEKATLEDGNPIEYSTRHSCTHIAVISAEDEMNALYHLFCGLWVHKTTGRILCLIFKFESALRKANKVLEAEHKRIFSLPGEIIIGIGSTIKMEIECESHPGLKVINDDGSGGKLVIDGSLRDTKLLGLVFRVDPPLKAAQDIERYRFICHARVFDHEDNFIEGGFESTIRFTWPQLPASAS